MQQAARIVAIVLVAVGLVWIGQGSGVLAGRSFMVGDVRWAIAGLALAVAGLALWWRTTRAR